MKNQQTETWDQRNPGGEACDLRALVDHAQEFLDKTTNVPAVLIKVGDQWCPVRADISETGDHRNAVAIRYYPPPSIVTYRIRRGVGPGSVLMRDEYRTEEDARLALADAGKFPMDVSYHVVRMIETTVV